MIANCATILIGLWLVYRAIFSLPPGAVSETELIAASVAVIVLALWARRTDVMGWHSGTNIALAVIVLLLAAAHRAVGVDSATSFWMILLVGIAAAVIAMWSILYRPKHLEAAGSR